MITDNAAFEAYESRLWDEKANFKKVPLFTPGEPTMTVSEFADFLFPNNPDSAKTVRETYTQVAPGVYESNAPKLSKFHQKILSFVPGTVDRLGDFFKRHGFARCEKHTLKLRYYVRVWVFSLHDKRVAKK